MLERLEKIERAVELKGLGQPQAEIDKKQAAVSFESRRENSESSNSDRIYFVSQAHQTII